MNNVTKNLNMKNPIELAINYLISEGHIHLAEQVRGEYENILKKNMKANANLIAATPELLRALEASLTRLSQTIDADVISMVNSAMNKAKGE
jgi:hypothetical protein